MTPYEKARALRAVFYAAIPLFLAGFLLTVLTQSVMLVFVLIAILLLPWGVFVLAKQWPACPSCGEKLLEESQGSDMAGMAHGGGFSIKLDRPRKKCGYCGQDLTVMALRE